MEGNVYECGKAQGSFREGVNITENCLLSTFSYLFTLQTSAAVKRSESLFLRSYVLGI